MFVLANIMYLQASYTRAKNTWERAMVLYPTSRFAFLALYQLGDCYRRLADIDLEAIKLNRGAFIDQNRQASAIRIHHYNLETAAVKFQKLTEDIQAKRAGGAALTELEADLLRRALFDLADCLGELSKYEDSRQIYGRLAADYQERIDGVEALKRLYYSYTVINPPDRVSAADVLNRLELLFKALPDSAFAGRLESESRKAYENWLEERKEDLIKLNKLYGDPKKGLPEIISVARWVEDGRKRFSTDAGCHPVSPTRQREDLTGQIPVSAVLYLYNLILSLARRANQSRNHTLSR